MEAVVKMDEALTQANSSGGGRAPSFDQGDTGVTMGSYSPSLTGEPSKDLSIVREPKHGLWSKKNLDGGEEQAIALHMAELEKKDFLTGEGRC